MAIEVIYETSKIEEKHCWNSDVSFCNWHLTTKKLDQINNNNNNEWMDG
jgi:hypothetical protein